MVIRAPIVILSLIRSLIIGVEGFILDTFTNKIAIGIFFTLLGCAFFMLAGLEWVPPYVAAVIGLGVAIYGLTQTIAGAAERIYTAPVSTAIGLLFIFAAFGVATANLLRQM
ncbi:MAG: hypothetical protein Q6351_005295 [Candidatus Njordarchaeum guaymaensis]